MGIDINDNDNFWCSGCLGAGEGVSCLCTLFYLIFLK